MLAEEGRAFLGTTGGNSPGEENQGAGGGVSQGVAGLWGAGGIPAGLGKRGWLER